MLAGGFRFGFTIGVGDETDGLVGGWGCGKGGVETAVGLGDLVDIGRSGFETVQAYPVPEWCGWRFATEMGLIFLG